MSDTTKSLTVASLQGLIKEYLEYCNQVYDYNYSPPMKLDLNPHELYYTSGHLSNIKRQEEPTFIGFANWLAYTKVTDLQPSDPETNKRSSKAQSKRSETAK